MADVKAQAGVAEGSAGASDGSLPEAAPLTVENVAEGHHPDDKGWNPARGMAFTGDHPEGGDYQPVPPPPAEDQHAAGLQPQAAEDEAAAAAGEG